MSTTPSAESLHSQSSPTPQQETACLARRRFLRRSRWPAAQARSPCSLPPWQDRLAAFWIRVQKCCFPLPHLCCFGSIESESFTMSQPERFS